MFSRIRKPDRRSEFERVALIHTNALFGTAMRLTRNQRDAEDLVQDAFLSAYKAFDSFEPGTQCRAWLFKILTNLFINKYRRRVLETNVASAMQRDGSGGVMSASAMRTARETEASLLYSLMGDAIQKALAELPEEFRLAVVLCDVEEFSYREIADIMECPVGTVMSRLHRGRKLLQHSLREHALRAGIIRDVPTPSDDANVIPFASIRKSASGGAS